LSGADAAGVGMPRNPGTPLGLSPTRISRQAALTRAPLNPGYLLLPRDRRQPKRQPLGWRSRSWRITMPSTLVAHEQPVSRIFSNDYVFSIPPYQRPYAWTTDQAGELFDDLIDFMENRPDNVEDMPPYFLGSIVLIK
jgi:uncharacterized protein DUF262